MERRDSPRCEFERAPLRLRQRVTRRTQLRRAHAQARCVELDAIVALDEVEQRTISSRAHLPDYPGDHAIDRASAFNPPPQDRVEKASKLTGCRFENPSAHHPARTSPLNTTTDA